MSKAAALPELQEKSWLVTYTLSCAIQQTLMRCTRVATAESLRFAENERREAGPDDLVGKAW